VLTLDLLIVQVDHSPLQSLRQRIYYAKIGIDTPYDTAIKNQD